MLLRLDTNVTFGWCTCCAIALTVLEQMVSADMMIEATYPKGTWLPASIVFGRALEHFHTTAKKRVLIGLGIDDDEWQRAQVHWVITIPSIWGERAKAFMKEAAKVVGRRLFSSNSEMQLHLKMKSQSWLPVCHGTVFLSLRDW